MSVAVKAPAPAAAKGKGKGKGKASSAAPADDSLRHRAKARGLLNASNLPALQNLLKRDQASYEDDFKAQWNHYQSLSRIIKSDIGIGIGVDSAVSARVGDDPSNPSSSKNPGAMPMRMSKDEHNRYLGLLAFVAQLTPSYPHIAKGFPEEIADMLLHHHSALTPDIRMSCVKSLVLLRNRDYLSSEELLRTLLPLLSLTTSATLRQLVQRTILSDLKTANLKSQNLKLNRMAQGWLFSLIQKGIEAGKVASTSGNGVSIAEAKSKTAADNRMKTEALWAVRLACELWRKHIWRDAKTVQILAEGCFHPHPKVQSSCIRFFLGDLHSSENTGEESDNAGSDSDEMSAQAPDMSRLKHQRKVKKKTKSGDKKVRAGAARAKKINKQKQSEKEEGNGQMNAVALDLLHDPQTFAEKLYDMLRIGDKKYPIELKVRIMQLLSRVMSLNKSTVLGFYSFVVK